MDLARQKWSRRTCQGRQAGAVRYRDENARKRREREREQDEKEKGEEGEREGGEEESLADREHGLYIEEERRGIQLSSQ